MYYHILALEEGKVSEEYNINKSHRVVILFEHESILKATLERVKEISDFDGFEKFFILKSNQNLEKDFFNNWFDLSGGKCSFF